MELYEASEKGDLNKVTELCKKEVDLNFIFRDGNALIIAAEKGFKDIVVCLLEKGFSPNSGSNDYHSILKYCNAKYRPLTMACARGHIEIVKILIDISDELDAGFYTACYGGHTDIIQLFFDKFAYNEEKFIENINIFERGIRASCISPYINSFNFIMNFFRNKRIKEPSIIFQICFLFSSSYEVLTQLIYYSDPNFVDDSFSTSLMNLCLSYSEEHKLSAKFLIDHTDVNIVNYYGENALLIFCKNAEYIDEEIFRELLTRSDPLIKNMKGFTPLYYAIKRGHSNLIDIFLKDERVISSLPFYQEADFSIKNPENIAILSKITTEYSNMFSKPQKNISPIVDDTRVNL